MATINNIANAANSANVGIGSVSLNPKLIKGALIVPKGTIITTANLATLQTVLAAMANNDVPGSRLYPIGNFVDFKDNSEKEVEQSFGYGSEVTVRDGVYRWQFQFVKGGKTLNDALRVFNGDNWDFFFVDQKNVLMGTQDVDSTTGLITGVKAIPCINLYTMPYGLNDGKKVAEYMIKFVFDPKYLNELGSFIADATFDILDNILGLQSVILAGVADATSGSYDITVKTALGVSLYGQYGNNTGLAQATIWKATNVATGADIIVLTAAATASGNDGFIKVGLDKTDTDYPSGSGAKIAFNLVGPAELATAGVVGFESTGAVQIVKN